MTDDQLLNAIQARNTYSIFANAFRQHDLDVIGQGWAGTRSKLEELLENKETSSATLETLEEIYFENLLYTHKAVMLWSIEREAAHRLAKVLEEFIDPESPYLAAFPRPLTEDQLKQPIALGVPTGIYRTVDKHTLFFASKRTFSEEETLPFESVPQVLRDAGFTEVVGKKTRVVPVFDSVTVTPDIGLVEMRIDLAKGMSERDILKHREAIRARFNTRVNELLGIENLLGDALNLVDALNPLYHGTGWIVQRIGHVNEGGYINSNRGRHRIDDVRTDNYHKNGEAAVDHLQLWNVNAVFKSPQGHGMPVLILEGHSSMLSAEHPYMDIARVLDCASEDDYNLVFSTLLKCLQPATDTASMSAEPDEIIKVETE